MHLPKARRDRGLRFCYGLNLYVEILKFDMIISYWGLWKVLGNEGGALGNGSYIRNPTRLLSPLPQVRIREEFVTWKRALADIVGTLISNFQSPEL